MPVNTRLRSPGVKVIEKFEEVPIIEGAGIALGSIVVDAERGPVDRAVIVTSERSYQERYGNKNSAGSVATKLYFQNGGGLLAVARITQEGVLASAIVGAGNGAFKVTSVAEGVSEITITLTSRSPTGGAPDVTVSGSDITIDADSDNTISDVVAAINADVEATLLVVASLPAGSDGSGQVSASVASGVSLTGSQGSTTAFNELSDLNGNPTLRLNAVDVGSYGNNISATTTKAQTALTIDALAGSVSSVVVNSVDGFTRGDVIQIGTDGNLAFAIAHTINASNKTITFAPITLAGDQVVGASVITASTHRLLATTTRALLTGATLASLSSVEGAIVGQIITFTDGITEASVKVISISGSDITFDAVTLGSTIGAGAVAASQEFDLGILDKGELVEIHTFLSMSEDNIADFVENRIGGQLGSTQSEYVSAIDLDSTSAEDYLHIPAPPIAGALILSGGTDGGTPQSDDYIGTSEAGAKRGFYLFDAIAINFMGVPGQTTAQMTKAGESYVTNRNLSRASFIAAIPAGILDKTLLAGYRDDLGIDSSRVSLYWPHLSVPNNFGGSQNTIVDPIGAMMGVWASSSLSFGVHKAPANVPLQGVLGLETDGAEPDFDDIQASVNPLGINVIRPFPGLGIRPFGARTLFTRNDGRNFIHKRRTLDFIQDTIKNNSLFFAFEAADENLLDRIFKFADTFLYEVWGSGALFPTRDASRAYFVRINSENNPESELIAGRIRCDIGVNIVGTAEFITFSVGGAAGLLQANVTE